MTVKIGHASISERGTINGSKGDSTEKEVCVRNWYAKPWDFMAIHPDAAVREAHAKAIEAACANDNIGYGQDDRNTLNTQAKAVDYDLSKVSKKCNCDCSSLQNVAAVAAKTPGVTYGSNGWVTSNMKSKLKAAGYKIITASAYLTSEDYCVRGAIYVKSGSHTVCGLSNGSKASKTLEKAGISTGSTESSSSSGSTGSASKAKVIGTAVAKTTINVRKGVGTKYESIGTVKKGETVEVLEVLNSGWYKIVWKAASCGYAYTSNNGGAYYTYTPNSTGGTAAAAKYGPDSEVAGTYKTTTALNMRTNAGTSYKIVTVIPAGRSVKCYGYYNKTSSGTKWLLVEYDGKTGYCSSKHLSR